MCGGVDAGSPTKASADWAPTATPSYCRLCGRLGWRGGFTGKAQRAGGLPASSQPGRVSARGGPGAFLLGGPPLGLPDEETEARGRRQGLGPPWVCCSLRAGSLLSGGPRLAWCVCVCGGCPRAWGRGDLFLSHGAGPRWVAVERVCCPHFSPTSVVPLLPQGAGVSSQRTPGTLPTCRGWTATSTTRSPELEPRLRLFL